MSTQYSVLLHWNLDYAEFPRDEAENIINMSYVPMVEELLQHDLEPGLMNITGHTLEYLENHHEPLIQNLRELINSQQVELVRSASSHQILPLLPRWRRIEQKQ